MLDPEVKEVALKELLKVPAEELYAVYASIMAEFAQHRDKLNSPDASERESAVEATKKLGDVLRQQINQLYRNVGVDAEELIQSINKNLNSNEGNLII